MDTVKGKVPMKKDIFFSHPGIIFLFFILAFLLFSTVYSVSEYRNLVKNWNGPESADVKKNMDQKKDTVPTGETAAGDNLSSPGIQKNTADSQKKEYTSKTQGQTAEAPGNTTAHYSVSLTGDIKNYGKSPEEITYHVFSKIARKASSVFLSGDFNGWKKTDLPLKKNNAGIWETRLPLLPGTYSYVYIVDGEEQLDDFSTGFTVKNGRKVSVLNIK